MKKSLFRLIFSLFLLTCLPGVGLANSARTTVTGTHTTYLPLLQRSPTSFWLGPEGGIIVALAADPRQPAILYAGTWGGGVFKSLDSGTSWFEVNQGLGNLFINSLAVDPLNPNILFVGTYKDKVYKSTDGANHWFAASNGIQPEAVTYSIAIDPQLAGVVYAGTRGISNNGTAPWSGVLYKSVDGGVTWQPKLQNIGGASQQDWIYSIAITKNAPSTLFAASHEHGPFRSDNRGESWYPVSNGISDGSGRVIGIDPQSTGAGPVYMGVWHRSGVFKTVNGGLSWILEENGISDSKVYSLAIDPLQTGTLYLGTANQGVMKSANGGLTWFPAGNGLPSIYGVLVDSANTARVFAGTAGSGLLLSANGGNTWARSQAGLKASVATALVVHPADAKTIFTSLLGGGVMKSSTRGDTWSEFNYGLGDLFVNDLLIHPKNSNVFYALTNSGGLYRGDRSTSLGWQRIGSNLPLAALAPIQLDEISYTTFNAGLEFEPEPLTTTETAYAPLLCMAFAPSNSKQVYLGTAGSGLYRSFDEAATWQPAGFSGQVVSAIAVDPANASRVWAASATVGGLKVSSDAGASWQDGGLPGLQVHTLRRSSTGNLYAGTNDGLYRHTSTGWVFAGLKGSVVTALGFHPTQSNVILAGTTGGAWVTTDQAAHWAEGPAALHYHTVQGINFDWGEPGWVYFNTRGHGVFKAYFNW